MENEKSKKLILGILVGLSLSLLVIIILFATGVFKVNRKNESSEENTTTTVNNKQDNNQENNNQGNNNQNNNQVNQNNSINADYYVGDWYKSEDSTFNVNASNVKISSIIDNKITFGFYITRVTQFENIEANLVNGEATFNASPIVGGTSDGSQGYATGKIKLNSDNVEIIIESTNIMYLNNETFKFNYRNDNKQVGIIPDNYIGTWYESEEHSKDVNANSIEVISVEDYYGLDKIKFGFYITRTAQFENIECILVSTHSGDFEADAVMGPTKDGSQGKVSGSILFNRDNIVLTIKDSNIVDLNNQTYTFKYRKNN